MFEKSTLVRMGLLAMAMGIVGANEASAETVAWWRFENGAAGTTVTATQDATVWAQGIPDVSGNGNHLGAFNESSEGVLYTSDIPPVVTGPNTLGVQSGTVDGGLFTWSNESTPSLDMQAIEYPEFTVEAFFKPTASDVSGWNTIVGWDGGDPALEFELGSPTGTAYEYYRIEISAVAGGGGNLAHLAEVQLLASDGTDVTGGGDGVDGTVTFSSETTGGAWIEEAWEAFDNDPSTFWTTGVNLDTENPAWIQFQLNTAAAIETYTLQPRNGEGGRHPTDWTLLGSNDGTTWDTLDTRSAFSSFPGDWNSATLYFQLTGLGGENNGKLRINYIDKAGQRWIVDSPSALLADNWYYGSAVMDGSELRLYVSNLTDGDTAPVLVGTTDVSASPDPTMVPRVDVNPGRSPDPRSSWSVLRGYWGSNDGDWMEGVVDEVRISNSAVSTDQMLLGVGVPVELSTFEIQ